MTRIAASPWYFLGKINCSEGTVRVDSKVRVLRGKRNVIYTGTISSLKVVKYDVREVPLGSECGLYLVDYSDFEDGDILECFSIGNNDDV